MPCCVNSISTVTSRTALVAVCVLISTSRLSADGPLPVVEKLAHDGSLSAAEPWRPASPRAEISPDFTFEAQGGPNRNGALVISSDERSGLHGCWQRTFAVEGGKFYQFESLRKTTGVRHPRRST